MIVIVHNLNTLHFLNLHLFFLSAKSHSKEWLLAEKEKFDSEFDKDKDGILNASEILSWVVPSNE